MELLTRCHPFGARPPSAFSCQHGIGARGVARPFTQADVTRAVKAAEKAGLCVARIKFTSDGFELVAGEAEEGDTSKWFAGSPLYRKVA